MEVFSGDTNRGERILDGSDHRTGPQRKYWLRECWGRQVAREQVAVDEPALAAPVRRRMLGNPHDGEIQTLFQRADRMVQRGTDRCPPGPNTAM